MSADASIVIDRRKEDSCMRVQGTHLPEGEEGRRVIATEEEDEPIMRLWPRENATCDKVLVAENHGRFR